MPSETTKIRLSLPTGSGGKEKQQSKRAHSTPVVEVRTDRRREPRYCCDDPVEIRTPGGESLFPATVMNVSRTGLRLGLDREVRKGAQLEILLKRQLGLCGRVRYCHRVGAGYQVGILLEEPAHAGPDKHVTSAQVTMYLNGHGLTLPQVVRIRKHLARCNECRTRVIDAHSDRQRRTKSA